MHKISPSEELRARIQMLTVRRKEKGLVLKEQLSETCDSFRPANIIKRTCRELISSDGKADLVTDLISQGAGFLTRKIVSGGSINPFKYILVGLVQKGVTAFASKHSEGIGSFANNIINKFTDKK